MKRKATATTAVAAATTKLTRKWGLDSFKEMRVATSEYIESLSASKSENSLPASEAL